MDAWFAGFHRNRVAVVWMGYDAPRKLGDSESGGGLALPVWIEYMSQTLKGVPVAEAKVPEGVINVAGEWYYDEYSPGQGISTLGTEDAPEPQAPTEDEKKGILDLFR